MRDIEQQGARGIGYVDRPHPGETEADVIFGQQKAVKSPPDPGFVGPHPQQLGERKVGERGVGSQFHQALRPDGFVEIAALGRRALIAPDEGRAQNLTVAVQQHRAVHLAAKPDAGNLRGRDLQNPRAIFERRAWQAFHQSCGSCSAQPLRGDAKGSCSWIADAMTAPDSSMRRARVPPVPTSMPSSLIALSPWSRASL